MSDMSNTNTAVQRIRDGAKQLSFATSAMSEGCIVPTAAESRREHLQRGDVACHAGLRLHRDGDHLEQDCVSVLVCGIKASVARDKVVTVGRNLTRISLELVAPERCNLVAMQNRGRQLASIHLTNMIPGPAA